MTKLVEGLKKANVRVTLITPSIYEQNADTGTENLFGCNGGLANCGLEVEKIARQFGVPVIDLHTAMDAINTRFQQTDPNFTLVGKDRVHPGEVGHFVMAYLILKAQGVTQLVSQMAVAADSGKILQQDNCRISQLKATASEVSFDCLEGALPFPVPSTADAALKLVPFQKELNQEVLKVNRPGHGHVHAGNRWRGRGAIRCREPGRGSEPGRQSEDAPVPAGSGSEPNQRQSPVVGGRPASHHCRHALLAGEQGR